MRLRKKVTFSFLAACWFLGSLRVSHSLFIQVQRNKDREQLPAVIVGNKSDLRSERRVS
jgi:hypothetical protein